MSKVALITGASKGIGKQIALTLAQNGYDIALNYRTLDDNVTNLEKEIKSFKQDCLLVQGSVNNYDEVEKMVKKVIDHFQKIDVLVNNAGIIKDSLLIRMSLENFEDVINTNLIGTFNVSKTVVSYMLKQKYGRIINISSVVGISGNAGQCNYAASKAGIIGFTKSLAKEVGSKNILVNAIAPGFIETDMTKQISQENAEKIKEDIPLKRMGKPEDVANLVKFLASDDSSYITGQVIHVDGGLLM